MVYGPTTFSHEYYELLPTRCPVLTILSAAARCPVMSSTDLVYDPTASLRAEGQYWRSLQHRGLGRVLRNPYAMSSTDVGYAAMETDTGVRVLFAEHRGCAISLRACYSMSGTDLAYAAIRLRDVHYPPTPCSAMSGTDLAYGATSYAEQQ
eukprot:3295132-Rhodomonas_salina.4